MKSKYKVLIHSMTFRRDYGVSYILAKLLERQGCESIIAHNTNYLSDTFRMWNPDAVFFVTMGRTDRIIRNYPNSEFFLWSGEGGEKGRFLEEVKIVRNKDLYDRYARIYLWGKSALQHVKDAINEEGSKHFLFGKEELLDEKFLILSNPRNDLVKYSPVIKPGNKIRIGFIGAFWLLNSSTSDFRLMNCILESGINNGKLTIEASFQVKLLYYLSVIINNLDPKKYEISIRPYPLEELDTYRNCEVFKQAKFSLDDSIDFCTWMNSKDIIIGTTSSTSCQMSIAKKPFINLDDLCGRSQEYFNLDLIPEELIIHSRKNCPKNDEELFNMIESYNDYRMAGPGIENDFSHLYNICYPHSSLAEAAKDISALLSKKKKPNPTRFPKNLIECIDKARMTYSKLRNKDRLKSDYSFFDKSAISHKARTEFEPILENIVSAPENKHLIS